MPEMSKSHRSHIELCEGYIEDLNKIFKEYSGKIAEVYIYPLARAIKEIQQQRENILSVIEREK
ncbi:MAG: hypothetical protein ACTSQE_14535 [Candidatus Heimdallarchaeaceae archaeon]